MLKEVDKKEFGGLWAIVYDENEENMLTIYSYKTNEFEINIQDHETKKNNSIVISRNDFKKLRDLINDAIEVTGKDKYETF